MTETECAEARAYVEKQIDQINLNLQRAEKRPNSESEQAGLVRKLRIHKHLLGLLCDHEHQKEVET